ncbi:MAG: hypothetical protein DA329_05990 [Candidatus Nitrosocosmicus sp.]|nr:hypothetical protein [Candidatus Nitrosocosmicus sp.]
MFFACSFGSNAWILSNLESYPTLPN